MEDVDDDDADADGGVGEEAGGGGSRLMCLWVRCGREGRGATWPGDGGGAAAAAGKLGPRNGGSQPEMCNIFFQESYLDSYWQKIE